MGASQSTSNKRPKVFHPEAPIEISSDVVSHLSARLAPEDTVQFEIHRALERENLDREMSMVEDGGTHGGLKTGASLIGDLDEIKEKVVKFQARRQLGDFPSVKETGETIASCYKMNATTPLECWREVAQFKAAVADVETRYLASFR